MIVGVMRVVACFALIVMEASELIVDCSCFRLFAVEASLILIVILIKMEVSNDSAPTQMLALTVVTIAEVGEPDLLKGLKVVFADRQHLLVHYPIHDIGARGICQRALVVIEGIYLEGWRL
jgi:hypothetical protein